MRRRIPPGNWAVLGPPLASPARARPFFLFIPPSAPSNPAPPLSPQTCPSRFPATTSSCPNPLLEIPAPSESCAVRSTDSRLRRLRNEKVFLEVQLTAGLCASARD